MPVQTKLPPVATTAQRLLYPFLRSFFFFFFCYVAYYPVRRKNKPGLAGRFIWASSHSNLLCDTVPPGYEAPCPAKSLAKKTLFVFPIKGFLEFCGALPIARVEDQKDKSPEARSAQNRATFKVAISALKDGWPLAIFPEGTSIVAPGLVLPLKPGVAKLGFAAEETYEFSLGLRVVPVGLEYGSRLRVASGLTIRYGNPLVFSDYRELHAQDPNKAVQKFMEDLTKEMIRIFPHFKDEKTQTLGKKLVTLGLMPTKYDAAQLFLRKENDPVFWSGLEQKLRAFEESAKDERIAVPAWGHRRSWKELGPKKRRRRLAYIFLGLPIAIYDLVNNSFPEYVMKNFVDYVAVDETEKMSLRFMTSPVVLSVLYGLQFLLLRYTVWTGPLRHPVLAYLLYAFSSFFIWYAAIHWRRQFKRLMSVYLFKMAGLGPGSESVLYYRNLRQYLSES